MSATRPPMHDDRFTSASEASRRGAHRARSKPLSASLPVLAGIAVVLLVVGGVYIVLGGNQSVRSDSSVVAAPASTQSIPAADATTAPSPTQAPSGQTTSPKSSTTTEPSSNRSSGVDKGVSLVVLNSIAVRGLAAQVRAKLESDGWSVDRTGNSINKGLSTTKIYYGRSTLEATANALQDDLGYGQVLRDTGVAKSGIVVVLGHDAQ
jgi:hypothetical protein